MGTLTADTPELPGHCRHKLPSSCRLTASLTCCACQDRRNHAPTYTCYVDGVGLVNRGTRWQRYCWFCKEFWENRLRAAVPPIDPKHTKVPDEPDQTVFVEKWFEYYRGYKVEKNEGDGSETRIPLTPEKPWRDTAPGTLPVLDAQASVVTTATRRAPRVDVGEEEDQAVSLDATLDELMMESDDRRQPHGEDPVVPTGAGRVDRRERGAPQRQDPPATAASAASAAAAAAAEARASSQRLEEMRTQLGAAEERRRELAAQLGAVDREIREFRERRAQISREQRTAQAYARIFGTREEMQRQGSEYVSPLASMFTRAYDRYRIAEEVRAEERASEMNVERHRRLVEQLMLPGARGGAHVGSARPVDPETPTRTLDDADDHRPPPLSDQQMTVKLDCKVCLQQRADTLLMPCGHLIMCQYCAAIAVPGKPEDPLQPLRKTSKCPLCRKGVRRMSRVYMA